MLLPVSLANELSVLHVFYGQGCPHCANAIEYFNEKNYSIEIVYHEVYSDAQERDLFFQMAQQQGEQIQGVPTFFINNKMYSGFSNDIAQQIEAEILNATVSGEIKSPITNNANSLTVMAVVLAAIVDAINPCAFAVLIILLSTILVSKNKRKAMFAGFAFTLSIFISYYLMGIGIYSAINAAGFSHIFILIVGILAIILGLFNLKDYLWYGKWFVMEVPLSWRPRLKKIISGVTSVPGAFVTGFLVSLFLLPCTSGPYIVILGLLSDTASRSSALWYLLLYNFIFVLPMIIITLAVTYGFTTVDKAEAFRTKKLQVLHLISGIIILVLGLSIVFLSIFGKL